MKVFTDMEPRPFVVLKSKEGTVLRRIWQRIVDLLLVRDFQYSELQGSLIAMFWGLWLLNPWTDVFSTYSGYQILGKILPEMLWGAIFTVIGLIQLLGLLWHNQGMRRNGSFAAALLWMIVWLSLARSSPWFLSTPTTFMFFVGAAWGYLRIARETNNLRKRLW